MHLVLLFYVEKISNLFFVKFPNTFFGVETKKVFRNLTKTKKRKKNIQENLYDKTLEKAVCVTRKKIG